MDSVTRAKVLSRINIILFSLIIKQLDKSLKCLKSKSLEVINSTNSPY